MDPFGYIIQQIGKTTTEIIEMSKKWIKIIYQQKGKWLLLLRDTQKIRNVYGNGMLLDCGL